MAGAMRFTTVELAELDAKIAAAADRALAIELGIFEASRRRRSPGAERSPRRPRRWPPGRRRRLADSRPSADWRGRWSTARLAFAIEGGRHPVVEAALARAASLHRQRLRPLRPRGGAGRIWLVTGPNMAGKSTFLRQNALIAVLAQMGCLRAGARRARSASSTGCSRRVGAADDLARGRSTFMVEMVETAAILNQATPRSLVILDEIGRGTATFDGLSIAWAAIEHLHEVNRCRALFATHFHELTALADAAAAPRQRHPEGQRNGTARWCSCTRSCRAPPTAPTASRSRGSPACRRRVVARARDDPRELEQADREPPAPRPHRRPAALRRRRPRRPPSRRPRRPARRSARRRSSRTR